MLKKTILIIMLSFSIITSTSLFSKRYSPTIAYMRNNRLQIIKSSSPIIYSENKIETEHFIIYFGYNNPATTFWADYNKNNIPDFIDFLEDTLEYVYNFEINNLGYNSPLTDGKCIVIVANTGVKVNSEEVTIDNKICGYSYKEDNFNVLVVNPIPPSSIFTKSKNMLRVTLAHEFFHIIQFGYSMNLNPETNLWLYEGTAVWMENQVFPDIDDYIYSYAEDLIFYTKSGLAADNGFHPYGSALFFDYLSNKFGINIIKDIWDEFKTQNTALMAIKNVIENKYSTDFKALIYNFYKALLNPQDYFSDGDKLSEESFKIEPEIISCNKLSTVKIGMFGAFYFSSSCNFTGILKLDNISILIDNTSFDTVGYNLSTSDDKVHILIPFIEKGFNSVNNIYANVKLKSINFYTVNLEPSWNLIGIAQDMGDMSFFNKNSINTIWSFDNNTWRIYAPDDKVIFNNFLKEYNIPEIVSLKKGSGIWINVKSKDNINFESIKLGNCGIDEEFENNWNLESTSCICDISLNSYLSSSIKTIWKWDKNIWKIWSPDEEIVNLLKKYKLETIDILSIDSGFWVNK